MGGGVATGARALPCWWHKRLNETNPALKMYSDFNYFGKGLPVVLLAIEKENARILQQMALLFLNSGIYTVNHFEFLHEVFSKIRYSNRTVIHVAISPILFLHIFFIMELIFYSAYWYQNTGS